MAAVIKVNFVSEEVKSMVIAAGRAHAEQDLNLPAGTLAGTPVSVDSWDDTGVAMTFGAQPQAQAQSPLPTK